MNAVLHVKPISLSAATIVRRSSCACARLSASLTPPNEIPFSTAESARIVPQQKQALQNSSVRARGERGGTYCWNEAATKRTP